MNSDKFNMYAGAIIGSLLLFLLLNFFSGLVFVGVEHEGEEPLAFAVAVEEGAGGEAKDEKIDFVALVAAADLEKGAKIFKKCSACHKAEQGANGVGPTLYQVVDRAVGTEAGYSYSDAMASHGGNWTLPKLVEFLGNPKGDVPGTKMGFAGLPSVQDRVDVIAYLNQESGGHADLNAEAEKANAEAGSN